MVHGVEGISAKHCRLTIINISLLISTLHISEDWGDVHVVSVARNTTSHAKQQPQASYTISITIPSVLTYLLASKQYLYYCSTSAVYWPTR